MHAPTYEVLSKKIVLAEHALDCSLLRTLSAHHHYSKRFCDYRVWNLNLLFLALVALLSVALPIAHYRTFQGHPKVSRTANLTLDIPLAVLDY